MLINDRLKIQFGSWLPMMENFITSPEMDKLFGFLKSETTKGKVILPESKNVFKSFELCDRQKVKALIISQDPYNTKTKEGKMIADGVPMSCELTGVLQPSLECFYQQMEDQCTGFDVEMDYRPDNSYLLSQEGVMLINSSLTVEMLKPSSHEYQWLPFMQYFLEKVINVYYRGLPIVLIGGQAQKLEKFINPLLHYVLKVEHMAFAARENRSWRSQEMFNWINKIIESNNGPEHKIRWIRHKNEDGSTPLPEWTKTKVLHEKKEVKEEFNDLPFK